MSGRLLHLMRHGETMPGGHFVGRTDCPATPAGIEACRRKGEALRIDAIVSSDLVRARACAEAIGPGVTLDPRWRELDFGAWDGRPASEVDQAALGRFWDDPDAFPPPGGERWSDLRARVSAGLADIPGGDVLVMTHGGAIRAALSALFDLPLRSCWAFDLPCAALLTVRLWPEGGAQIVGLAP